MRSVELVSDGGSRIRCMVIEGPPLTLATDGCARYWPDLTSGLCYGDHGPVLRLSARGLTALRLAFDENNGTLAAHEVDPRKRFLIATYKARVKGVKK